MKEEEHKTENLDHWYGTPKAVGFIDLIIGVVVLILVVLVGILAWRFGNGN